ncbi:hypothetical protein ABID59_003997 [Bradyrhizobium sp. S3.3.6]
MSLGVRFALQWSVDASERCCSGPSPVNRDIKLGRGTYLMHLEETRYALYSQSIAFLASETPAYPAGTIAHPSKQEQARSYTQWMR